MQQSSQLHKPLNDDLLQQEIRNGHNEFDIKNAWSVSQGNMSHFRQILQGMKNQSFIISPINQQFNDDIQVAISASLTLHQQNILDGKVRKDKVPCGLLNVGNTCYFNCLLQAYYFIYEFVSPIIKCNIDNINLQNIVDKRVVNSIQLLKNLQNLFVFMIGSDRQFVDPKDVILSICDDFGKALPIGDQKDVGEFNNYFLSRIDEAMTYLNQTQSKGQQTIQQYYPGQSEIQFPNNHQYQQNKSFISQKSILSRKSSAIAENSILYNLFYGKFSPIIIQGQGSKDCEQEIFNYIQIDVNSKFLMDGLEKQLNQVVEYNNDNDGYQQAIKEFWISQAPQILSFQIQRVEFNKQFMSFTKINSTFQFDKEIYIDRFLLSNKKIAREIQTQNQQMSDRLKKIEQELEILNQFNGNIQIIQNLETTLQFLKLQTSSEKSNPFYVDNNDNKAAIKSISEYHQYFIKKRDSLLKEQKETELKISKCYNTLKKQKYILQSILMHEGSPSAGHYFAYIYNFDDQKWYVFNDSQVQEETEENILKYAFGDQTNSKSAYLIQYVKEDKAKQNINAKYKMFSTSSDPSNYLQDKYGLLLSDKQKDLIKIDNKKLQQEVIKQQLDNQIEIIVSIYHQYLDIANEKQRKYQQKQYLTFQQKPLCIENFAMYLKIKPEEKMFRWVLLDYAIKKMMPSSNGLFGPTNFEEIIKASIIEEVNKFGYNKPIQPIPTKSEFQTLLDEYKHILKLQGMIAYVLEQYNNNNLKESVIALHSYMKLAKLQQQSTFFYNVALKLKPLILLGIICKIIYQKNICDSDIIVLKLVIAFQMQEHFLYNDKELWSKQLMILIGVALSAQNEKLIQEVLRPLIQNKKDFEMCALLDAPSQNIDQQIQSIQSIYLTKQFESDLEDFLLDNLMISLQNFCQIKCISILFEKISKSSQLLDKNDIFKIIEENPQNK